MPHQTQRQVPRETYIALRARRQAYRIASDILYEEPIDVSTLFCQGCGAELGRSDTSFTDPMICPHCDTATPVPAHLLKQVIQPAVPLPPALLEYMTDEDALRQERLIRWTEAAEAAEVQEPVPGWLWWFTLLLLGVLLFGAFAAWRLATE